MKKVHIWLASSPFSKIAAALSLNFVIVAIANAATTPPPNPITSSDNLLSVICNFITYFFWIVILLSVIMVLVAAFHYITAGDDTEKTSKARRTLTYAAVGIGVALCALGFPMIVASLFPNNPNITVSGGCSF